MFQEIFSFKGRIRRLEYGLSIIFYFLLITVINAMFLETGNELPILGLLHFPALWFLFSQNAKRCHDLGNSGWYQIIPFYGFFLLFADGDKNANIYGNSPKESQIFSSHVSGSSVTEEMPKKIIEKELPVVNFKSKFEIRNVSYGNLQELLKQLRSLNFVKSLTYEIRESIANVAVTHDESTQYLLDEFIKITQGINVIEVIDGSVIIKIK